jgi:hypothetical protein
MEITTHDSVKLFITVNKSNNTEWTQINAVDKDNNQVAEITFFGKQELVLGESDD